MDLHELLDRLADFEPTGDPVISLYVDTRPDDTGRDHWRPLVRKELGERARTWPESGEPRRRYEAETARVLGWLETETPPSATGAVVFACEGAGLFEGRHLDLAVGETALYVGPEPQLYPLARLVDRDRRYAVVLTDSRIARILVVALGAVRSRREVAGPKTRRSAAGGWSQARYQRHIDQYHLQHVKEVAEVLQRVVREEGIERVVLAGEDSALALLREQLPKSLAGQVVDVLSLGVGAPEAEVLAQTLAAARRQDAQDDAERVARMLDAYRAGGLGVVGLEATRRALDNGQVHELLLPAAPEALEGGVATADELVTRARRTGARVTMIEEVARLTAAGGVGALLRYRLPQGRAA